MTSLGRIFRIARVRSVAKKITLAGDTLILPPDMYCKKIRIDARGGYGSLKFKLQGKAEEVSRQHVSLNEGGWGAAIRGGSGMFSGIVYKVFTHGKGLPTTL
ncbi:MAG: hypothetical protein NXY59_08710 [Aigarchaeota archaeon]|nr:hypothetical protein [Candidatus Pelearchaeum maunauluense]